MDRYDRIEFSELESYCTNEFGGMGLFAHRGGWVQKGGYSEQRRLLCLGVESEIIGYAMVLLNRRLLYSPRWIEDESSSIEINIFVKKKEGSLERKWLSRGQYTGAPEQWRCVINLSEDRRFINAQILPKSSLWEVHTDPWCKEQCLPNIERIIRENQWKIYI